MIIPQVQHDLLPFGEYVGRIQAVEIDDQSIYGTQVKFTLEITTGEHAERQIWTWASAKFSRRSKLYGYAKAAIFQGQDIPEDYDLDINHFVGRPCLIRVDIKDKEDGTQTNKVLALIPITPVAPAPIPQHPAVPPIPQSLPMQAQPAETNYSGRPAVEIDNAPF